ncbi:homeobox protein CDX-4-like [Discoglossus pictus]
MYVSYFADQENSMYTGSRKYPNNNLPMQNVVSNGAYPDYMEYQHASNMDNHGQSSVTWGSPYGPPKEEWNEYGHGSYNTCSSAISGMPPVQMIYESPEYKSMPHTGDGAMPLDSMNIAHLSNNNLNPTGRTRTKEKYRVVYTDHQRIELEKEFLSNRYITIRRKSEIALNLGLSDRQVKIWFQNRRAKERKLIKKTGQFDGSVGSVQSDSGSVSPADISAAFYSRPHTMNGMQPMSKLQFHNETEINAKKEELLCNGILL